MVPRASAFPPKTPLQPPSDARSSMSPGYFGFAVDRGDKSSSVTSQSPKPSQPLSSASKRSPRVSSPRVVPLTSNPEFDAFRKQTELNRVSLATNTVFSDNNQGKGKAAQEVTGGVTGGAKKRRSQESNLADTSSVSLPALIKAETAPDDSATSQRSPKRLLSNDSVSIPQAARRQSPADFNEADAAKSLGSPPQRQQDKSLRLSLPGQSGRAVPDLKLTRAETLPSKIEPYDPVLISAQYVRDTIANENDSALILDMRVATQYAQSRIKGALNLCIPTTLLKRTTYNASKLADTFQDEGQKARFQKWASFASIIVYDNASTQLKEANSCVNVLKKFAHEGWTGQSLVLRGGFVDFSRKFPAFLEEQGPTPSKKSGRPSLSLRSDAPDIPPVVGGCPMPGTDKPANPFFGNIRQNMDLIGGVGQMPIQWPSSMSRQDKHDLPDWMRRAADERDHGKRVAEKFLQIEKREKKRMEEALSTDVYKASKEEAPGKIQIAGIEKGSKNRYHNIMPYEHSRVKLKGVQNNGCDYVNANFLETSLSSKRYIATQGPIPATFGDFWNMVWQQEVKVMVMLTAEMEGNQVKANNYWSSGKYGPVQVDLHSERTVSLEPSKVQHLKERQEVGRRRSSHLDSANINGAAKTSDKPVTPETPSIVIRRLTVTHENRPFERMRQVTQLHWASWPDFGVPTHPSHLLGVVEQCRSAVESNRGSSVGPKIEKPVLVHCSAGCGRTGTFCTVDTVIDSLKRHKQDRSRARHTSPMQTDLEVHRKLSGTKSDVSDPNPFFGQSVSTNKPPAEGSEDGTFADELDLVEKVVEELRLQRLSTVQSLRQYVLCYETVLEWIADQGQPKTA